ncbi:asparagine synthase-related protein [Marinicaulis aureus]|uniref:asparagine synthase (glutamine-hydrolyzing) n=1 Tax=Hyphococcus aureus TaxID=2666033 RepID=A0ABW1KZ50_9PROT
MSGVFGVFYKSAEAAPVEALEEEARRMAVSLRHRGRDDIKISTFADGFIGHVLKDTGCNGLYQDEDGYIAVLDGRIDALSGAPPQGGGDFVLRAFLDAFKTCGSAFLAGVTGDFALAIWDPNGRELFLARDRFGVCPLYFCNPAHAFAFASETPALIAAWPAMGEALCEDVIVDYVAGAVSQDHSETVFRKISRLPPAHGMKINAAATSLFQYYDLGEHTARAPDIYAREGDAAAQFRFLLNQAVDRRSHGSGEVGCMLSGGLDSSSIVCLAAKTAAKEQKNPLLTASLVYGYGEGEDESFYIDAVNRKAGHVSPLRIDASHVAAFGEVDKALTAFGRPPFSLNCATASLLIDETDQDGRVRILLDGSGGDEVVSRGANYLVELAQQGNVLALWKEIDPDSLGAKRTNRTEIFRTLMLKHSPLTGPLRSIKKMALGGTRCDGGVLSWAPFLRGPARCLEAPERYEPALIRERLSYGQQEHLRELLDARQALSLEMLDHQSAHSHLEVRYPFWDQDLVEFCVGLPSREKWRDGFGRSILRRGLADDLPKEVAERRDKYNFAGRFLSSLRAADGLQRMSAVLYEKAGLVDPYVNVEYFRTVLANFKDEQSAVSIQNLYALWRVTMLSAWLESRQSA